MFRKLISQVQVSKSGVPAVGFSALTPPAEAQGCEFPPNYWLLCQGWGLWQECASASPTYFNVGFFLICSMCRSCSSSFWVSFRGSCFLSSYRFSVSVGGGSKSSYVTILNQSPLYRIKYKIMRSQSKGKIMKCMKAHPRGNMRSRTSKSQYDLCLPLYTLFMFQRQNQVNTNTVSQWDMVERNEGSSLLWLKLKFVYIVLKKFSLCCCFFQSLGGYVILVTAVARVMQSPEPEANCLTHHT